MKRPLKSHRLPFPQALESRELSNSVEHSNDALRCRVLLVQFEILLLLVEVVNDFSLQIDEIRPRPFSNHDCHGQSSEELACFREAIHIVFVVVHGETTSSGE